MDETEIRDLFSSKELYPVSNDIVTKYITTPRRISVKKLIQQVELIPVKDYIVNDDDTFSFTLLAYKYCIYNYRPKFTKLFIDTEESIKYELVDNITMLEDTLKNVQKNHIDYTVNKLETTDVNVETDLHIDTYGDIKNNIDKIVLQLTVLPKVFEQVNKLSDVDAKIDKLLCINLEQINTHTKKINSINI